MCIYVLTKHDEKILLAWTIIMKLQRILVLKLFLVFDFNIFNWNQQAQVAEVVCLLTQLTQNLAPSDGTENVYLQSNLFPVGLQAA